VDDPARYSLGLVVLNASAAHGRTVGRHQPDGVRPPSLQGRALLS
jgi:hypothetical protein